jgi:prepilin signal peptidase PulO-like enzyme (type II secretory pathway)
MVAAIPFGPFLALSALEYLFLGEWFYGLIRGAGQ